jgi:hypothetical protein
MTNRMRANSKGTLTVLGTQEYLKRFKEFAREGEVVLSVNKFIPNHSGWAASWDLTEPEIEHEVDTRIMYKFGYTYSINSDESYESLLASMGEMFPMLIFVFRSESVGRHIRKGQFLPNQCGGVLLLKGPTADLKRFKELAKTGEQILDAENFIPCLDEFKELVKVANEDFNKKETLFSNLYFEGKSMAEAWRKACEEYPLKFTKQDVDARNWCIKNWGTWLGFRMVGIIDESDNHIDYIFSDYASPITPVIKKMSTMFPTLSFDYDYLCHRLGFQGRLIIKKGRIKKDEHVQAILKGDYK